MAGSGVVTLSCFLSPKHKGGKSNYANRPSVIYICETGTYDPSIIDGWASCVRVLLSQPGIDINIKNNRGCTAMMDARYKSLGMLKQIVKTCNNFPADSYGKVVLCGDSGAGKSTLTQVSQMLQAWRL